MRVSYMLLALTLVGASATGCKKIAGLASDAVKGQSGDPAKSSAAIETMSHYAKGFNALIDRPQGMIKTYYREFGEAGPEGDKKHHLSSDHTFAESKITEAKTAFAAAAKSAPDSLKHLEPLATAATADMDKISATYKAMYSYYQAEDFKDDKGAKAKQLHGEFVKVADSFRQNIAKFEAALTEIESKQADEELKEYADKATISHQFRFFNRQANKLINAKPDGYLAAYPAVETAYNELTAFQKTKPDAQPVFKTYVDSAERFFNDAKRLKREMEAKAKDEDLDQIRDSMTSSYNTLVSLSNSLRDLEANNLLK